MRLAHALAATLGVLSACGGEPIKQEPGTDGDTGGPTPVDPLSWSPTGDGPFRVAHQRTEASYTDALGEPRTIAVHVWYPTEATDGAEVRYDSLFIQPEVLGDAPAAAPVHTGGYPTIVHSHGAWGVAGGAGYWGARLVSQGWVLIAPEHAGDTFSDGFPDFSGATPTVHYIHRPQDMTAALDHVAGAGLLAGELRTDAVALSGHSRGAYTAWTSSGGTFDPDIVAAACAGEQDFFPTRACTDEEQAIFTSGALDEPRFQASLVLDGGIRSIFGDDGHRTVHAPFLVLRKPDAGGSDQAEYDRMDGIAYAWVSVEGACHETFNVGVEASTQAPCETFEQERGWDLTATYATAFFRHHILGDTGAETLGIVDGSTTVDPAATMQSR